MKVKGMNKGICDVPSNAAAIDAMCKAAVERMSRNETAKSVAIDFKIHPHTLADRLRKRGLATKRPGVKIDAARLTYAQNLAYQLAKDRKRTRAQIAEIMNTSEECVSVHLNIVRKKLGITTKFFASQDPLPPLRRRVWDLHKTKQVPVDAIAERLGVTEKYVSSILSSARCMLRRAGVPT